MTEPTGRDRLRELIDAVLDGVLDEGLASSAPSGAAGAAGAAGDPGRRRLEAMAGDAYASPFHFSRQLRRDTGEPPVSLRRRVLLERAAWQLARGTSVTEAALTAGYDSVEGFGRAFARAFGHPPSATPGSVGHSLDRHWLPAPNGIHFHPPTHLWVEQTPRERPAMELVAHLVHHDLDDTGHLLEVAARLPEEEYRRERLPGHAVLPWDGEEPSVAATLERLVFTKEVWLASIAGADHPRDRADDLAALARRHADVAPRWAAAVRDIELRGAWGDTLVDALCDPPESFVLGSVVAHVLTYSAHRRQLARLLMRQAGLGPADGLDHGDPIEWLRGTAGHDDVPEQTQEQP